MRTSKWLQNIKPSRMLNFSIYGGRKASEVSGVLCWGRGEAGRHVLLRGPFLHHAEETDARLSILRAEAPRWKAQTVALTHTGSSQPQSGNRSDPGLKGMLCSNENPPMMSG